MPAQVFDHRCGSFPGPLSEGMVGTIGSYDRPGLAANSIFTSRKVGQHVLQVEGQGQGVESFSFLEKNYEKIIRKNLK